MSIFSFILSAQVVLVSRYCYVCVMLYFQRVTGEEIMIKGNKLSASSLRVEQLLCEIFAELCSKGAGDYVCSV